MNELITINHTQVQVKEYQGHRVVTFKDIDMVHGRPEGTAKRNFYENREHLIEGEDYFIVTSSEKYEIRTLEIPNRGITLLTESGYLMLVKSLSDDLAWEVQRKLVNNYFRGKRTDPYSNLSKELQAIFIVDRRTQEIEHRVEDLENHMTIDYGQQQELNNIAKSRAIEAMLGLISPAYENRSLRGKVFSAIWKDYKDYFDVNSYRNTAKKDFGRAKEYLRSWQAQGKLLREIENCNNQIQMDKEAI